MAACVSMCSVQCQQMRCVFRCLFTPDDCVAHRTLSGGGNSEYVYIKDNSFLNTSSNKEFNDCSLNQSNIEGIPRSKACGSTSCELESNDVRCICPGAGKKDEEEKNLQKIAGDLILVFKFLTQI